LFAVLAAMPENRRTPQAPQDTIVKTTGHPNEHRRTNFQELDSIDSNRVNQHFWTTQKTYYLEDFITVPLSAVNG